MPLPIVFLIAAALMTAASAFQMWRQTGGAANLYAEQVKSFRAQGYSDADIREGFRVAKVSQAQTDAAFSQAKTAPGLSEEDRQQLSALGISMPGADTFTTSPAAQELSKKLTDLYRRGRVPENFVVAILSEAEDYVSGGGKVEDLDYYKWITAPQPKGQKELVFDREMGRIFDESGEYFRRAEREQMPFFQQKRQKAQERAWYGGYTGEEMRKREQYKTLPEPEEEPSLTPMPEISPELDPYLEKLYPNLRGFYERDIGRVLTDPAMKARQQWLDNIHTAERNLARYEQEWTQAIRLNEQAQAAIEGRTPREAWDVPISELERPGGQTLEELEAREREPWTEAARRERELGEREEMVGWGNIQKEFYGRIEDPLKKHLKEFNWEEQFLRLPPAQRGFYPSRVAPPAVWRR